MALNASFDWNNLWRYSHSLILLLKYPLAFIAGWGGLYYKRWTQRRNEQKAQGWPSVEGRIVFAKVAQVPKTTRYLATISYTYFVGEYRSGEYHHEFSNEIEADNFARALRDKNIQIRYKESDPHKSVLEQRAIEQHILLAPRFG